MHHRRHWALCSLVAVALVLSAGWTGAGAQDKPRSGGELLFVVPSEPPSYDAHAEETFGVIHPMAPHYSTLVKVDPFDKTGTKPVGDLAESWTISKEGLVYTFKLRHGVKFHDGSDMTSKDVKASYDKIIFPPAGVKSLRKDAYRSVEVVEAPDPYTVRFRLKYPESSFLLNLASPWNWIYKADILAKDMNWYSKNVMGTGPFTFVEHVKGSHWVGKKNPNYWDKGKPYLDGYRAMFMSSSSAQVAAIRGERAHIQFRGFSPAERDQLVQAMGNKITVQESPWDCLNFVSMHHEKKPFDDKRVRRALSLALDRYEASQKLSKITIVRDVSGVQVPGTPYATPPAELEKLAGYGRDINADARRGQAAAARGRRARRVLVHLQEPRHPASLRAGGHLARGPVAADRAERQDGDDRGLRVPPHAQARGLRGRDGLPVRLHRRARPGPAAVHQRLRRQLRQAQGQDDRRAVREAGPGRRRGGAQEARPRLREAPARRGSARALDASSGTASSRTTRK